MHRRNYRMIKRHDTLEFDQNEEKNFKNRIFLQFFPSLIYICLLSLDPGVSEKLPLKVPADVVEGSARATYSVLGESASPGQQLSVSLLSCMQPRHPWLMKTLTVGIGLRERVLS